MSSIAPDAYDMLNIMGVIPADVHKIVYEKDSPYLAQRRKQIKGELPKDEFNKANPVKNKPSKKINWNAIGLSTLLTYLAGVALSKGKLNPVEGMQALGKTLLKIVKFPIKLLRK